MNGKYSLYAGALQKTDSNLYSYFGGNSTYMLVYTDNPLTGDFIKIPVEKESNLTEDEKLWLNRCKVAINTRHVKKNIDDYSYFLNEFLDKFEKELKSEKEKQTEDRK